ncbi:MAG: TonB-dependent receptor [Proteobacteria bacterium]|nr:TonB-dependent receptor [Cystobacterineae bacterium]MCL2313731.1 TonB-dependent receptor [Pseudomonadota bacterium]
MSLWVAAIGFLAQALSPSTDEVHELAPVVVPLPPPASPAALLEADSSASSQSVALHPVVQEGGQARELLSKLPGAHVQESGGMGQLQRLSIRGGDSNAVRVLVDGMSWGLAGESVDLAFLPMALLESASLIRGAAAVRFGPGAMAGALLLSLSKTHEERLFVELLGGSFGSIRGLAGGSGKLGGGQLTLWVEAMHSDGNFRYRFSPTPYLPEENALFVSKYRQNNAANNVETLAHYALPLAQWQLEAWTLLGFHKRGLAGPVENPTPSTHQKRETLRALLRAQGPLGKNLSLQLSSSTQVGNMLLHGGGFGEGLRQRNNSAYFMGELGWARGAFSAFLQGNFHYERLKALSLGAGEGAGTRVERFGLGAMLGGEVWLFSQKWGLNALARMDKAGPFAKPSAKLGTSWFLPGGFACFANAGQSFRIPSFFELYVEQGQVRPNPQLQAESATSLDANLSWENEKARASLGVFYNRFDNLVVWEYLPPFALKPFNLGKAQTYGLELSAAYAPWPWWQLELAYTWLKSQNLQEDARYEGKPLPFRPQHQLFVRMEVGPRWLSAFVEGHTQSSQIRNRYANLQWPARSLLHVGLKSQLLQNPQLQLSLTLRNLLNTHSQDMAGYPLPPRALFLGLALSLDRTPPPPPASRTLVHPTLPRAAVHTPPRAVP